MRLEPAASAMDDAKNLYVAIWRTDIDDSTRNGLLIQRYKYPWKSVDADWNMGTYLGGSEWRMGYITLLCEHDPFAEGQREYLYLACSKGYLKLSIDPPAILIQESSLLDPTYSSPTTMLWDAANERFYSCETGAHIPPYSSPCIFSIDTNMHLICATHVLASDIGSLTPYAYGVTEMDIYGGYLYASLSPGTWSYALDPTYGCVFQIPLGPPLANAVNRWGVWGPSIPDMYSDRRDQNTPSIAAHADEQVYVYGDWVPSGGGWSDDVLYGIDFRTIGWGNRPLDSFMYDIAEIRLGVGASRRYMSKLDRGKKLWYLRRGNYRIDLDGGGSLPQSVICIDFNNDQRGEEIWNKSLGGAGVSFEFVNLNLCDGYVVALGYQHDPAPT